MDYLGIYIRIWNQHLKIQNYEANMLIEYSELDWDSSKSDSVGFFRGPASLYVWQVAYTENTKMKIFSEFLKKNHLEYIYTDKESHRPEDHGFS